VAPGTWVTLGAGPSMTLGPEVGVHSASSYLPGSSSSTNGSKARATLQDAVFDGLRFAHSLALGWPWEFGGLVCELDVLHRFIYTGPVTDYDAGAVHSDAIACAYGTTRVARFHAHTKDDEEGPSGPLTHDFRQAANDLDKANSDPTIPYFVIAPSGTIYRYQGPDALHSVYKWITAERTWAKVEWTLVDGRWYWVRVE
jgi:hypothetical protein